MSLWIRSQDKETLINVNKIEITDFCDAHKNAIWGDDILLGKYSSKEKALKVLDMIQEFIKNMYVGVANYMGKPFQMPLDGEVKE